MYRKMWQGLSYTARMLFPKPMFGSGDGYVRGYRGLKGLSREQLDGILNNGIEPKNPIEINSRLSRFIGAFLHEWGIRVGYGFQEITDKYGTAKFFARRSPWGRRDGMNVVLEMQVPLDRVYGLRTTTPLHGTIHTVYGKIQPGNILNYTIV